MKTYVFVSHNMYGGGIIIIKAKSKEEAEEILKFEEDIFPVYVGTIEEFVDKVKKLGDKQFWGYWEGYSPDLSWEG